MVRQPGKASASEVSMLQAERERERESELTFRLMSEAVWGGGVASRCKGWSPLCHFTALTSPFKQSHGLVWVFLGNMLVAKFLKQTSES